MQNDDAEEVTMADDTWVPADIPQDRPSAARMYDYFLGGFHNFEIDRRAADQAASALPDLPFILRTNRAFLYRAVRFLVQQGIDQFLDIGSGIPTVGNVHEVAGEINPAVRVVYVDIDPVAVSHSQAILRDNPNAVIIQADVRQPESIVNHPVTQDMLDFTRPVGMLMISILHFIHDDDEAYRIVRMLHNSLASGSYLVIAHASGDGLPPAVRDRVLQIYARSTTPLIFRSREQIEGFFDGLNFVEPGVVYLPQWQPDGSEDLWVNEPERSNGFGGVGRKP